MSDDNDFDFPRLEDAALNDLEVVYSATPKRLYKYGGFTRAVLAGIYAERANWQPVANELAECKKAYAALALELTDSDAKLQQLTNQYHQLEWGTNG